ncbi:MAG: PIN domain-containing protein [bacterium]
MRKESLYLDTSVPNAYYDKRDPNIQKETIYFFKKKIKEYEVYVSEITVGELRRTREILKRTQLLALVEGITVLSRTKEAEELADLYVRYKIIPLRDKGDALHIAIATLNMIDILVSWNFEHMVKRKTKLEVNAVNILQGYKTIEIVSPQEI